MMFVRQMCGKKTLFLCADFRITKEFEKEKNIQVVITSRKMFKKYKAHIMHALHSKVKVVFLYYHYSVVRTTNVK